MKKLLCVLLSALLILSVFTGCSKVKEVTFSPVESETEADVRIVSFNVAGPWGNALKGTSGNVRVERFAAYMNAVKPDSIGTQEMNSEWMEKLKELMPEYDSYGVQRGGDDNEKKSEMNSIFWLKDKYDCLDSGTFWLSETPDVESKYEGAGCYRVCSYVKLLNKETGECYYHFNTHLDNASDEARVFGADVIKERITMITVLSSQYISGVVLTGDFNDYLDGPASSQLVEKFNVQDADRNTYHDWGNITDGRPIDFVFTSGEIVSYEILDDTSNGLVSDHYGIYETISFKR
ncbi:MAG: endonuclease/exonuclease/phosphatase family protein [Eubacterium sp.]|nr:endonuclease/exonuclease/phosphatase family protein [Eubacterium sp.]MDE6767435.1 endonuclease/exonuclease/phosphatase family protein [Eubacterium sp.]